MLVDTVRLESPRKQAFEPPVGVPQTLVQYRKQPFQGTVSEGRVAVEIALESGSVVDQQITGFDGDDTGTARRVFEQAQFTEYLAWTEVTQAGLDSALVVEFDATTDTRRARFDQVQAPVFGTLDDNGLAGLEVTLFGDAGRKQLRIGEDLANLRHGVYLSGLSAVAFLIDRARGILK